MFLLCAIFLSFIQISEKSTSLLFVFWITVFTSWICSVIVILCSINYSIQFNNFIISSFLTQWSWIERSIFVNMKGSVHNSKKNLYDKKSRKIKNLFSKIHMHWIEKPEIIHISDTEVTNLFTFLHRLKHQFNN